VAEATSPSWTLDDVEEQARQNPTSFFIPSLAERRTLRVGQQVQLHFVLSEPGPEDPRAERMWVRVASPPGPLPESRYEGVLLSKPGRIVGLEQGTTLPFCARHVASVLVRRGDASWFAEAGMHVFVSERALAPQRRPRFVYREPPDNETDSGWRMMDGDESDAEIDDARNVRRVTGGWLNERFPDLSSVWGSPDGVAFEWTGGAWRRVPNSTPG